MENKLTLASVFPFEIQKTLKTLTVEQSVKDSPILVLSSNLDKQSAEKLPQESKLIVVGATKALAKLTPQERSEYVTLDSHLRQNPLLEQLADSEVNYSTKVLKNCVSMDPTKIFEDPRVKTPSSLIPGFGFIRSILENTFGPKNKEEDKDAKDGHNTATPEEVKTWFAELVKNSPLILDNLNPDFYSEIIVWLSAHFSDLIEKNSIPILNLVIIGYPSLTQSYFELTSVKLTGWAQESEDIISESKKIGINGDFIHKQFHPRASIIKTLRPETIEKACAEILTFFE